MKAKSVVRLVFRRAQDFLVSVLCRLRPDCQGIVSVDPLLIKFTVNKNDSTLKGNDMWHLGTVSGGDWDLDGTPVNTYGQIYSILRQRMKFGKDYHEIPEYLANLKLMASGETVDNCSSEPQYLERWGRIEKLYLQIENEGYRSQVEMRSKHPLDEIRVQVGRDGGLLFEEGLHRVVIAQLLRIEKIPVLITRRHRLWVDNNRGMPFRGHCEDE